MNRKINCIILIFLILASFCNFVNANELTTYTLQEAGIKISIDSNMYEIITGLNNNDERLNFIDSKEDYLANYKNNGILLDAVDSLESNKSNEILVIQNKNMAYRNVPDINTLAEEQQKQYYDKFVNSIKEQANLTNIEIISDELYKSSNNNVYFHIISKGSSEEGEVLNLSTYYTIMNQRLITIGIRYFNTDINKENEQQIIENITYDVLPREETSQEIIDKIAITVISVLIILIIAFIIIRKRDKKQIDKNIKDKEIIRFSKFGGILSIFWLINLYQIFLRTLDIKNVILLDGLSEYKILIILQSVLTIIINVYLCVILLKKDKNTPYKLKKAVIISVITIVLITLLRIVAGIISNNEIYTLDYFKGEISYIVSTIIYTILWFSYLTVSQRVKIYYKINSNIENINIKLILKKVKENIKNKKINKRGKKC